MCDRHGKSKALAPSLKVNCGSRADPYPTSALDSVLDNKAQRKSRPSNIILSALMQPGLLYHELEKDCQATESYP